MTSFRPLIFHINSHLLEPSGFDEASYTYEIPSIKYMDEIYIPTKKTKVDLTFSNGGSGFIYISGNIEAEFKTTCTRCLGEAIYEIDADVEGYILLDLNAELPEDIEEDECIKIEGDRHVDLSGLVYSSILLELPLNPICSENCTNSCISQLNNFESGNTYMPFKDLASKL